MIITESSIQTQTRHVRETIETTSSSLKIQAASNFAGILNQVDSEGFDSRVDTITALETAQTAPWMFGENEPPANALLEQYRSVLRRLFNALIQAINPELNRANPVGFQSEGNPSEDLMGQAGSPVEASPERPARRPTALLITTETSVTREEFECSQYESCGSIRTADGREIAFSLNVSMERSFTSRVEISTTEVRFKDPLVLNYEGEAAELQEQTFAFDLDLDGEPDQLSLLGENSLFLALDRDENGVIDDGSELFGALTGDGFSELAAYDADNNQFIDAADPIFDQLLLWSKTDSSDRLVRLSETEIGALYLGAQRTPFELNDQDNQPLGKVQATSFYLTDSGNPGSLQQIDFAV